jgi:hypothetical protein
MKGKQKKQRRGRVGIGGERGVRENNRKRRRGKERGHGEVE